MTEGDRPEESADGVASGWRGKLRVLLGDERVRFLLVGGVNTVLGLLVFIGVDVTIGILVDELTNRTIGSLVTLAVSQVISVLIAFVLHRKFVFRVRGHVWLDLLRFQSVYLVTFVANAVLLPVLVALGVPRIAAQTLIVAVMTVVSYLGHRHFSFRRRSVPQQNSLGGDVDPRIP